MPPSTQGFVALEMLNIMEGFDIKALGHNSADYLHLVTEAKQIAFADRGAVPRRSRRTCRQDALQTLICRRTTPRARRREIDMRRRARYAPASPAHEPRRRDFAGRDLGDTIYLTAADGDGNVVSLIQSLFGSFGAGFVAGDTGITLHNRGSGFTLHAGPSERDRPAQAAAAHAGAGDDR